MITRKAIVNDASGLVESIVMVDDAKPWAPPAGTTIAAGDPPAEAESGWAWDGSTFSPPPPSLHVDLVTQKWDGAQWVEELKEFTVGDKIRVEATARNPDDTVATYVTGAKFRVPLFEGRQGPPAVDGSEVVIPTIEQALILPLAFTDGVATFDFIAVRTGWLCAVPGRTSKWLNDLVVRAVVTAHAP